jgi:hypothetical protein
MAKECVAVKIAVANLEGDGQDADELLSGDGAE